MTQVQDQRVMRSGRHEPQVMIMVLVLALSASACARKDKLAPCSPSDGLVTHWGDASRETSSLAGILADTLSLVVLNATAFLDRLSASPVADPCGPLRRIAP